MLTLIHLILSFSRPPFIAMVIILGFIFLDRKIFFKALQLILLSIICNYALKVTFQVPLNPILGKVGFGMPSGHMQSATVFYGWLSYKLNYRWFKPLAAAILLSEAYAMEYMGYHNFLEILAGAGAGIVLIVLHEKFAEYCKNPLIISRLKYLANLDYAVLLLANVALLHAYLYYGVIATGVWLAYAGLWGISAGAYWMHMRKIRFK